MSKADKSRDKTKTGGCQGPGAGRDGEELLNGEGDLL